MNILLDKLSTTVDIYGYNLPINADFRTSIKFEMLLNEYLQRNIDKVDFHEQALLLYYNELPTNPDGILACIEKLIWFYGGGDRLRNKKEKSKSNTKSKRIYDFEYDADYFYSAFLSQYNIDLNSIKFLHWWKFLAMFRGLSSDNKIIEIMSIRALDLNTIKDKEQKKMYAEKKALYEIPVTSTDDEKLDEITKILLYGGDLKKALDKNIKP